MEGAAKRKDKPTTSLNSNNSFFIVFISFIQLSFLFFVGEKKKYYNSTVIRAVEVY